MIPQNVAIQKSNHVGNQRNLYLVNKTIGIKNEPKNCNSQDLSCYQGRVELVKNEQTKMYDVNYR